MAAPDRSSNPNPSRKRKQDHLTPNPPFSADDADGLERETKRPRGGLGLGFGSGFFSPVHRPLAPFSLQAAAGYLIKGVGALRAVASSAAATLQRVVMLK